ncbi:MAG TPA: hypothetical protein VIR57_15245, partial [Chloroflexota bacterium]
MLDDGDRQPKRCRETAKERLQRAATTEGSADYDEVVPRPRLWRCACSRRYSGSAPVIGSVV